jgi:cbb3-type cytochrome oxidase subunit 3
MMSAFLDNAPVIGLVFFFVFFAAVLAYLLQPNAKKKLEKYGNIPLENSNERQ